MIDVALALIAGVLTAGAPCILPMLPIVFGASLAGESRIRPLFIAAGFVAAFAGVALVFSAFTHVLGLSAAMLRSVSSMLLVVFGALMIRPAPFERFVARWPPLVRGADRVAGGAGGGNAGGFVIGMSLGAVWTPCAGPVLASILTLIATAAHATWAGVLLVAYAIGASLPMLAVAYGGQFAAARVRRIAPHSQRLQRGFGVLVVLVGAAIFFQYDTQIAVWLADLYPWSGPGL